MAPRRASRWLGTLFVLFTVLVTPSVRGDGMVSEPSLKSAFVYNFAKFIEWPTALGGRLRICVLGDDIFGGVLDALESKSIGDAKIRVDNIGSAEEGKNCQILFIAESKRDVLTQVLKALGESPVLTIADTEGFAARGVMIEMSLDDERRIAFDVNATAAAKANLSISSKLLRLARKVYQTP